MQLEKTGLCVWPNFLSLKSLQETRGDLDRIHSSGDFSRAGIGQAEARGTHDLRRDETYWLDRSRANLVQSRLWKKIDQLKQALNRGLFLGITDFEGHYASYPKGGFYRRHLDCFHGSETRIVSLVLYLNQTWQASDGGCLRIHKKGAHLDIPPIGGTLVCFLSKESEHEVLESHRARFSFCGWFVNKR